MAKSIPLRWGFLGTARINQALIKPIRSSKNSLLFAIASRSQEKAAEYAKTWGFQRFYASYDELLEDQEIDVIYNSLPNALHAEYSIKAMQSGKHVLCEKPLTTNSKDMKAVMNTASETGMTITEAFMYRHHPQTLAVKQMVENGEIGDLHVIRGSFCYINRRPSDIRLEPSLGGGSLWDIGCYPIGYALYLAGEEPIEVYGHMLIGTTGVDVLYVGQMLFRRGIVAQFECSFITPFKALMEIIGSEGRIIIPEPYKPGIKTRFYLEREGHTQAIKIIGIELYSGEVEDIENAILYGKPTRINLEDSRANLATIEALYKSGRPLITN